MYEQYYNFREKPFRLTPDPEYLYLSKQHQGALDHMTYGINQQEGFMAIVGDVGTGKTTLCRRLLDQLDPKIAVALVLNPMLSDMDLLRTCVHDLGVPSLKSVRKLAAKVGGDGDVEASDMEVVVEIEDDPLDHWVNSATKKELIDALNHFLIAQHKKGGATVLIIDEAQNLLLDVLEQLRILSNLETEKDKLLQIIFVGQLEFSQKLQLPELKQLNQRIAIRYEVTPLSEEETRKYINHRLKVAGIGSKVSFSPEAIHRVYIFSGGYPRLINLACDRALLAGYNSQTDYLEEEHAQKGIESLGLQKSVEGRVRSEKPKWNKLYYIIPILVFACAWIGYEFWNSNFGIQKALQSINSKTLPISAESRVAPVMPLSGVKDSAQKLEPGNAPELTQAVEPTRSDTSAPSVETKEGHAEYRIHVGDFSSENEANLEIEALKDFGFQVYSKMTNGSGQTLHTVYVGPYEDEKSAKIHIQALKYSGRAPVLLSTTDKG
jgi:general secretion pathway protein A